MERVFVLFFPYALTSHAFGLILGAYEKRGLTVTGLRKMTVRRRFGQKHFSRPGRILEGTLSAWFDTEYDKVFAAMILEGEDAINKARAVTSGEWVEDETDSLIWSGGELVYSSNSEEDAIEDIEMWFPANSDKLPDDCELDPVYVLPKGDVRGPYNDTTRILYAHTPTFSPLNQCLSEYCFPAHLSFILIKPVAVQDRRVGKIIFMLERSSLGLKGVKLVDMADFPGIIELSPSSSYSSGIVEDNRQLAIALVLNSFFVHKLDVTNNGDNSCCFDDENGKMQIDSNLIHISKSAEDAWELARLFFPNGVVLWPESRCNRKSILEASLVGL